MFASILGYHDTVRALLGGGADPSTQAIVSIHKLSDNAFDCWVNRASPLSLKSMSFILNSLKSSLYACNMSFLCCRAGTPL
jgi:hypothetical protein